MEVILDTNALSALLDGDEDLRAILSRVSQVLLSPIVLGEYRFGIHASRHRQEYEKELGLLEKSLHVLISDAKTAVEYAAVRNELKSAGTPIPWHDVWIAAQARQYGVRILSKDSHFDVVDGVKRVSWG